MFFWEGSKISNITNIRKHATAKKHRFAKELRRRQTPTEKKLWGKLKKRQTGWKITRQRVIFGWIVDFYCGVKCVAVEVDGGYHSQQKDKDNYRDSVLESRGILTLRFTNQQIIDDVVGVVRKIKRVCNSRNSVGREK